MNRSDPPPVDGHRVFQVLTTRFNVAAGNMTSWVATDPVFVIGNGTNADSNNAFEVLKNGNTTIDGDATVNGDVFIPSASSVGTGTMVLIDANGQLGPTSSSRRYKEAIQNVGESSRRVLDLRPVTFLYKEPAHDGQKPLQYGLIAEEVAEVFPELVVYNAEGQPESVEYQQLSTLLLNELQKQQGELAELKAAGRELQSAMAGRQK